MFHRIIKILFILLLSVVFIGSLAIAQGKGKTQSGDRPAGWDKGKKKGWQSDVPPGQEEEEEKKKQKKNLSGEEGDLEHKEKKEKKEKENLSGEEEDLEDKEKKEKKEKKQKKDKKAKKNKKITE